MKELKCKSCGATINVDEDKEYGTCPYCGSKYKLNEEVNVNINLDKDMKEIVKERIQTANKTGKVIGIIFIITFIVVILIVALSRVNFDNKVKEDRKNFNEKVNESKEQQEKNKKQFEIQMFNNKYNMYSGTQPKFFIEDLIGKVITNNEEGKDIIIVNYKESQTSEKSELLNLMNELTNQKYMIAFGYSEEGKINQITIDDIQ